MHRLNRAEYANTVRDLLGVEFDVAASLPPDDPGEGFDNQAAALSISPLHLEAYDALADRIVARSVLARLDDPTTWRFDDQLGEMPTGAPIEYTIEVSQSGTYRIAADAWGVQDGDFPPNIGMGFDGLEHRNAFVGVAEGEIQTVEATAWLDAGTHTVGVWFNNAFPPFDPDNNLHLQGFTVDGPVGVVAGRPDGYDRVFICDGSQGGLPCAENIARDFGQRAWRRPLADDEVERLVDVYGRASALGEDFEGAVGWMVRAMLVSPHFLFRVEQPGEAGGRRLNDFELASRLSYFLWATTPDDELLWLASEGRLVEDDVLSAQVDRMIADPRAAALVDEFGGQWLYTRAVGESYPDNSTFPLFGPRVRSSMEQEMRLFIEPFLLDDRPMTELVTARETYIDPRLARYYGWEAPAEPFGAVVPQGVPRAGILTQGGLLTALSNPTHTNVVRRGKWVLTNLMCQAPPPPPPGVRAQIAENLEVQTVAEQVERRLADPACSSCHQSLDPIGLSMERFDAAGVYRELDEQGQVIDTAGELPGDIAFDGVEALGAHLAADARLPRCITQQTFTYALGRSMLPADRGALDSVEGGFAESGYRFSTLVRGIVLSRPFRERGVEP